MLAPRAFGDCGRRGGLPGALERSIFPRERQSKLGIGGRALAHRVRSLVLAVFHHRADLRNSFLGQLQMKGSSRDATRSRLFCAATRRNRAGEVIVGRRIARATSRREQDGTRCQRGCNRKRIFHRAMGANGATSVPSELCAIRRPYLTIVWRRCEAKARDGTEPQALQFEPLDLYCSRRR